MSTQNLSPLSPLGFSLREEERLARYSRWPRTRIHFALRCQLSSAARSPANVFRILANRNLADLDAEFFISVQRPTTLKEVLTRDIRVLSPFNLYDELESRLA